MTIPTTPIAFDYEIIRAKRKTVAIHVRNGAVEVRAPLRVSQRWINAFVVSQTAWVLKKLNEKPPSSIVIGDGTIINYLGEPITIRIVTSPTQSFIVDKNELILNVNQLNKKNYKALFVEWIKKQAADYMVPRATTLTQRLDLNHQLTGFRFRITRHTWGHCSSKGIIQFNPLIMLTSHALVDYLIAHEVCHLQHMNHSQQYYKLLSQVCENYKLLEKTLKSIEHSLIMD